MAAQISITKLNKSAIYPTLIQTQGHPPFRLYVPVPMPAVQQQGLTSLRFSQKRRFIDP